MFKELTMQTTTITLRSDLEERLVQNAQKTTKTVNELVNEAVEQYLRYQQQIVAYERMYTKLKQDYLGQWIAIHHQKLVDHDTDGATLYRRIRQKYGRISVLIRQVGDKQVEEVWIHTPSTGRESNESFYRNQ
jgi:predicted DNA-binding protein